MIGLGTLINTVSIIAGGLMGHLVGKLFKQEQQDSLNMACGVSVLFIAMAGAMEGMLRIEKGFENFGEWLKIKTGNAGDSKFVNAFVTASLTVCIGAMGKGCVCSAIPVLLFEGTITLLARLVAPMMTELAVAYLSLIGAILIFCVGVNLVWGKKIRVANMLPAVMFAIFAAYLPWNI